MATRTRGTEIRVSGPTGIEDYHAHLARLDRDSRSPGTTSRSIDAHCLELVASRAILIGAYVDGVMRAAAEIVPDRTGRHADAVITIEDGFQDRGFAEELTARVIEQARRHAVNELRVIEQGNAETYSIPPLERRYAANG